MEQNGVKYIVRVGLVRKRWDGVYCQGEPGKDKNGVAHIVSFDLVRIKMGWSTLSVWTR